MENRIYRFDDWAKEFVFKDNEWVRARIEYTVDIGHPDLECIMLYLEENEVENGMLEFEDKYQYRKKESKNEVSKN